MLYYIYIYSYKYTIINIFRFRVSDIQSKKIQVFFGLGVDPGMDKNFGFGYGFYHTRNDPTRLPSLPHLTIQTLTSNYVHQTAEPHIIFMIQRFIKLYITHLFKVQTLIVEKYRTPN